MDRKTVIGSRRIKVIAAKNAMGSRSRPDARARRSPSVRRSRIPVKITERHKNGKVDPKGFFPKKEIKCPPQQDNNSPKAVWIGFHANLHERFAQSFASGSVALRRLSKGITIFRSLGLDYSFIRVEFPPLTSEMKYDILLALFGGKQIEPQSYRKEEVMSQMDSSNKPSAVASLLN